MQSNTPQNLVDLLQIYTGVTETRISPMELLQIYTGVAKTRFRPDGAAADLTGASDPSRPAQAPWRAGRRRLTAQSKQLKDE